jgi:hypothetical protein
MPFHIAIIIGLLIGSFNFLSSLFLKRMKSSPDYDRQLPSLLVKYAGIPPLGLAVVLFLLGLGFILGLKEYLETVLSNK